MPVPRYRPDQDRYTPPPDNRGCLWTLVFVVGIVALVIGLMVVFPNAPGLKVDSTRLVYLLVLLAVVVASVGSLFSESPGRTVRHVAIWTGIAAGLALLYSFRGELGMAKDRVVGEAMPAQGIAKPGPVGQRTITLYTQGGHFFAEAEVEGKKVMFIIDTGASDVVLSRQDAARVGIDPEPRDFTKTYETANGMVRGAPVVLDSVAIGPIDVRNVDASVTESDMTVSLLGMSFLNRLKGYQVDGDTLILKQ